MAEKKKIYLKKTTSGAQQYGSPEAFTRASRKVLDEFLKNPSAKTSAAHEDMAAGWHAAMAEEFPNSGSYEAEEEKRLADRARKIRARGYKGGGCVMPGRGGSFKGMK